MVTVSATTHTVPSLGFVVWERRRKLKTEFQGLPGHQIRDPRLGGTDVTSAARLVCHPVNHAYEARVELIRTESTETGLVLHNDFRDEYHGIAFNADELSIYSRSRRFPGVSYAGERVFLKLWNLNNDVVLFYSTDGETWHKFGRSLEVSSGHGRLRICLYAAGKGEGLFRDFRYHGLD